MKASAARRRQLETWGLKMARLYLQKKGYQHWATSWREAQKWKGGEVDLLYIHPKKRKILLAEVKCHRRSRVVESSLLSETQRKRLLRSLALISSEFPGYRCHWALIWVDPERWRLEFLENP